MSNEFDDTIDSYLPPYPTTIFDEFANMVFPAQQKVLKIENKNTVVSIFFEKRKVIQTFIVDNTPMNEVNNFVFLFRFEGVNNSGSAVALNSFLDESKAKVCDDYQQTKRTFNKYHHKLNSLANHKLIYHGGRNEG